MLFICLNVDYRVLFTPLTDEVARDGLEFYTTFFHAPTAIKVRRPPVHLLPRLILPLCRPSCTPSWASA